MLRVTLFGRFEAKLGDGAVHVRDGSKSQELLIYLLLHRQRPHTRETVACLLWDETSGEHSRAYLRKALWELQTALHPRGSAGCPLLRVDPTWVRLDPDAELWLDVDEFERAYERTRGVPGCGLDATAAREVADAVALFAGGLLQDRYQEWCLVERERLRQLYLLMLDKLVEYGETHGEYEAGLLYGLEILRHDPARERTHRQMMRLHHLRGDRTGALRQYRTCVEVLHEELGVKPLEQTERLFEEIRGGAPPTTGEAAPCLHDLRPDTLSDILAQLSALSAGLAEVRERTESISASLHAAPRG
jgi:DNA-binding SARP family transcriptional activator